MEQFIKVRFGDAPCDSFSVDVDDNGKLGIDILGLRTKILSRLKLPPDADLVLTYYDLEGDVVALHEDGDLHAVMERRPEFLSICVQMRLKKKKRRRRQEEDQTTYLKLSEAMECLEHICTRGCTIVRPYDMEPTKMKGPCSKFSTCKGVQLLIHHFAMCKKRVNDGCLRCKRLWQLLRLHSSICDRPDSCRVPLCRKKRDYIIRILQ
ncbi:BTB/POZ and TAZ domain-containing protein 2-like isoform X2 [Juglans microcarpa x Juglans regia]|uniref:BTB/POZ and TAZ domain-containing protein 2-like isoform X2 n=1 Tax=Juglans microcarpa x Juglans regia TaxID=2249226 RepID=UPI001B7EF595|nr:BTB/POZ and TAZ domain-containing protein 2-like isoform X2 [Juglans microcarpa x Juglans regia]